MKRLGAVCYWQNLLNDDLLWTSMGTTLVLSRKPVCSTCLTWEEGAHCPELRHCFSAYLAFCTTAVFLHGLAIFSGLYFDDFQSFRNVTCPEISEIKTIWQQINKMAKKEFPWSKVVCLWLIAGFLKKSRRCLQHEGIHVNFVLENKES